MASPHLSRRVILAVPVLASSGAIVQSVAVEGDFHAFLSGIRREAAAQGIRASTIEVALRSAEFLPHVIELDRKQPERQLTFGEYLERSSPSSAWTVRAANSPKIGRCSTGFGGASMSSRGSLSPSGGSKAISAGSWAIMRSFRLWPLSA